MANWPTEWPTSSHHEQITISTYFVCTVQDIWVLNHMSLTHFFPLWAVVICLSQETRAWVVWCYFTFYEDRESTASHTQNMLAQRHNDAFWFSLPAVLKLSGFRVLLETKLKYSQNNDKWSPTSPLCWVWVANNHLRIFLRDGSS